MRARLKLEYLPFRAMAETTRFMLRYGKIPYVDHVVWGRTFAARRSAGHYAFDKVPVIHVAERPAIPQSGTMARFAAKLAGCYPSGELEIAANMHVSVKRQTYSPYDCRRVQTLRPAPSPTRSLSLLRSCAPSTR